MNIKIITVGGKNEPSLNTLINQYEKRLPRHINLEWKYINSGSSDTLTAQKNEAKAIIHAQLPRAQTILLDERGTQLSSEDFSDLVFHKGQDVNFIIGGAYGVTPALHESVDVIWSLSKLVFPHEIVRLLLAEQLYRGLSIHNGHPYHHT